MARKLSDKKVRLEVYNKYNGRCAYCGCEIKLTNFHIDHIKPKLRYLKGNTDSISPYEKTIIGFDEIDNYNPSCGSCNASKGSHSLEEWKNHLRNKTNQLRKSSSEYRAALRFGLIKETGRDVVFYFETI